MRASVRLKRLGQPLPKVRARFRIIEDVTNAKHRIHRIASRNVENPGDHIHSCP